MNLIEHDDMSIFHCHLPCSQYTAIHSQTYFTKGMDLLYNIPNPMTGSPKTLVNVNKILCVTQAYLGMARYGKWAWQIKCDCISTWKGKF